eukprot:scaffold29134_cov96-Isochrysis_galbana.AAC.1
MPVLLRPVLLRLVLLRLAPPSPASHRPSRHNPSLSSPAIPSPSLPRPPLPPAMPRPDFPQRRAALAVGGVSPTSSTGVLSRRRCRCGDLQTLSSCGVNLSRLEFEYWFV